ncbi:MAG TPA: DUF1572 domain-containing protein [Ferruginibacter sp.]|nr:DUF1572 domain-containing protein [Ferruginibacter sp.]
MSKQERSQCIANRIREVFLNGLLVANTNLREHLQRVTWSEATQKIGNLNTIAELAFHIDYYVVALVYAFENGKFESNNKKNFGHPFFNTEAEWNKLVGEILNNAEKFAGIVEQMDDNIFDQPFIHEKNGTYLRNIEAVIEHSYYHLGQISLIRKIMLQTTQ